MFYLLINEKIRELINKIKDIHFGCKYYCPLQMIALDEMELLRKELNNINITFSDIEWKNILKSSESKFYQNVHICQYPNKEIKEKEEKSENEKLLNNNYLKKDKIIKNRPNPFLNLEEMEKNYEIYKKQKENDEKFNNKNTFNINNNSIYSLNRGISMIGSFFLLVYGAYFLGKRVLKLNESNTYILTLIVTIIVFLSETVLMLITIQQKELKERNSDPTYNVRYYKNSFAYQFNKNYRNHINNPINKNIKTKQD